MRAVTTLVLLLAGCSSAVPKATITPVPAAKNAKSQKSPEPKPDFVFNASDNPWPEYVADDVNAKAKYDHKRVRFYLTVDSVQAGPGGRKTSKEMFARSGLAGGIVVHWVEPKGGELKIKPGRLYLVDGVVSSWLPALRVLEIEGDRAVPPKPDFVFQGYDNPWPEFTRDPAEAEKKYVLKRVRFRVKVNSLRTHKDGTRETDIDMSMPDGANGGILIGWDWEGDPFQITQGKEYLVDGWVSGWIGPLRVLAIAHCRPVDEDGPQ